MSDVAGQPSQELAEIVGGLRDIHGIVVSEWRRALDGESGGAWLAICEGAAVVIKWVEAEAAPRFELLQRGFEAARTRGVPIPDRWPPLVVGDRCVLIQRQLATGATVAPTPELLDDVANAISQLGSIPAPAHLIGTWGEVVVRSLREGLDGWCEHGALGAAGGELSEVVRTARRVGEAISADAFPTADLMHLDLHTKNVLAGEDNHLTAIVDWEGACGGDLRFDLTYFAFAADVARPGIAASLWRTIENLLPGDLLAAYAAHSVLRMVDWSFRHHDLTVAKRWLQPGRVLLHRYA